MIRYGFSWSRMFATLCASCLALAAPLTAEAKFDESAVKGSYGFVLEGFITFIGGNHSCFRPGASDVSEQTATEGCSE
jgi:hypothetical protein